MDRRRKLRASASRDAVHPLWVMVPLMKSLGLAPPPTPGGSWLPWEPDLTKLPDPGSTTMKSVAAKAPAADAASLRATVALWHGFRGAVQCPVNKETWARLDRRQNGPTLVVGKGFGLHVRRLNRSLRCARMRWCLRRAAALAVKDKMKHAAEMKAARQAVWLALRAARVPAVWSTVGEFMTTKTSGEPECRIDRRTILCGTPLRATQALAGCGLSRVDAWVPGQGHLRVIAHKYAVWVH